SIFLKEMLDIPPPSEDNGDDMRLWPDSKHEFFIVALAYALLGASDIAPCSKAWCNIWKLIV
ncbi:hypothetical protein A2U01_0068244, partial [Trifolium medium]|nr:hypothetical protein [Trifolium medium]